MIKVAGAAPTNCQVCDKYLENIIHNKVRFLEIGILKLAINIYKAHSPTDKSPRSQLSHVHDLLSESVVMHIL